jgi:hypothetical protein
LNLWNLLNNKQKKLPPKREQIFNQLYSFGFSGLALLYRVSRYPVLEFPFSCEKGVGFEIFSTGFGSCWFFYLTGLKSSIGLLDIFGFSTVRFGNSFFIGFAGYWKFWFFAIIAFYSIGFGFWFWSLLGY